MRRLPLLAAALFVILLPLLAACAGRTAQSAGPSNDTPATQPAASGRAGATSAPTATAVPPTPTPAPTPTPVPEPRTYAMAGGGQFFAETGFPVQDEPGGPRFWTEYQRLGGAGVLGLPSSAVYDGPDQTRVQTFQKGWLSGKAGQPGVQAGDGAPPEAPAEARARQDPPEMALIGRVDVQSKEVR